MNFRVECPKCGAKGTASEQQMNGSECPVCGCRFIPPRPTFWERQIAASPIAAAPWLLIVIALAILWALDAISPFTLFAIAIIGLLFS